jgi:hypothetical protein
MRRIKSFLDKLYVFYNRTYLDYFVTATARDIYEAEFRQRFRLLDS